MSKSDSKDKFRLTDASIIDQEKLKEWQLVSKASLKSVRSPQTVVDFQVLMEVELQKFLDENKVLGYGEDLFKRAQDCIAKILKEHTSVGSYPPEVTVVPPTPEDLDNKIFKLDVQFPNAVLTSSVKVGTPDNEAAAERVKIKRFERMCESMVEEMLSETES